VNHSPSFHTDSELDVEVKEAVLTDTLRMLNTGRLRDHHRAYERSYWVKSVQYRRTWGKTFGQGKFHKGEKNNFWFVSFVYSMFGGFSNSWDIADLAELETKEIPDIVLISDEGQFKWELKHKGGYRLLFPTTESGKYDRFFEAAMRNELSSLSHHHRTFLINRLRKINYASEKFYSIPMRCNFRAYNSLYKQNCARGLFDFLCFRNTNFHTDFVLQAQRKLVPTLKCELQLDGHTSTSRGLGSGKYYGLDSCEEDSSADF